MSNYTVSEFVKALEGNENLDHRDKRYLSCIRCFNTLLEVEKDKVKEYQNLVEINHVTYIIFFVLYYFVRSDILVYFSWLVMIAFNSRMVYIIERVFKECKQLEEVFYMRLDSNLRALEARV